MIDINDVYFIGLWEFEVESSNNYWSDSLFTFFDVHKRDEIPDFSDFVKEFVHPEDRASLHEFESAFKNYRLDIRIKSKSGDYFWYEVITEFGFDDEKSIRKIHRTFVNINARKRNELQLTDREDLFLKTQEEAKIGTWQFDFLNNDLYWSDEVYRIHEIPIGTPIVVEDAINFYREDYRPLISGLVQNGINNNQPYDIEAVLITNSGNEKWVRATCLPVADKDGKVYMLRGLFLDIHKQKLASIETEIQKGTIELAAEAGGIGIWDWNIKTNDLFWNTEMHQLFSVSEEEFRGDYADFADQVHPDDLPEVEERLQDAVSGKSTKYDIDYRVVKPDGGIRHIDAKGVILKDDIGQNERMIGTCVDITQQKEYENLQLQRADELSNLNEILETEVQRRTTELTKAMVDLQTLTYSISHDLRAPLRAINGFINIIKTEQELSAGSELLTLLGYIGDNAEKMDERIRSILDYHRIGTDELTLQEISLESVFREEFGKLIPGHPDINVQFHSKSLPTIFGDVHLIRQLIQNLLDNAIKYSSKEEYPEIEVLCEEKEEENLISVRDNGVGFDMKYYEKLFQVFQRLHHESEFKGTGVGLSIAKRIVEKHNGTISAKSEVGKGTTIFFTIPKSKKLPLNG